MGAAAHRRAYRASAVVTSKHKNMREIWRVVLVFVVVASWARLSAAAPEMSVGQSAMIDGCYSPIPVAASDTGHLSVGLTTLLYQEGEILSNRAKGSIRFVRLRTRGGDLEVFVTDSANHEFGVGHPLAIETRVLGKTATYTIRQVWSLRGSGESGPAKGTTTISLSKQPDGSLFADVWDEAETRGFFRRKKAQSHSWIRYASCPLGPQR
jgi:hypothetical protein